MTLSWRLHPIKGQVRYLYAPPTEVERHSVFWSVSQFVRSFVRLSVTLFRFKILVMVVLKEAEEPT